MNVYEDIRVVKKTENHRYVLGKLIKQNKSNESRGTNYDSMVNIRKWIKLSFNYGVKNVSRLRNILGVTVKTLGSLKRPRIRFN